ncbi:hypothetical protein C8R46DRAFT_1077552 [Mycena filopes]|nr:hypothetical protein C8R46DRAFT_1077552 [Mycena filopes]
MSSILSPVLPLELERDIFETAAILFPEVIPSLLLVSHCVCEWTEQIRYRTVTANGERSTCGFRDLQRAIQSNRRPPSFFSTHVRHLVVPSFFLRVESYETVHTVLAACTGVQHLAFVNRLSPSHLPALAQLRPHRLLIAMDPLLTETDSVVSRPMFTSVTHLGLFLLDSIDLSAWPSFLNSLPSLTHLLLPDLRLSAMVAPILATCKSLQVLIDFGHSSAAPELDDAGGDDRFVYMKIPNESPLDEWLKGTRGEVDHWARADMFIAKKRRGEIEPKTRCWIEDSDGV